MEVQVDSNLYISNKATFRVSSVAQWVNDRACLCGGAGSIPHPGTSICFGGGQKRKKKGDHLRPHSITLCINYFVIHYCI